MPTLEQDLADRWTPSPEQDREAAALMRASGAERVYTAHLLINKEYGWWDTSVEVVPVAGVFTDRNEASEAASAAADKRHEATGERMTGGWTTHRLPRPGERPNSAGRLYETHWAVFEDILVRRVSVLP